MLYIVFVKTKEKFQFTDFFYKIAAIADLACSYGSSLVDRSLVCWCAQAPYATL